MQIPHKLSRETECRDTDIAIIGMGCRFPGGANSYQHFWQLLLNKFDALSPVPQSRWDSRKFYHPDSKHPAKTTIQSAGFIDQNLEEFDPLFFGISPREAAAIDPQQRLLLEVCWESIEDAGILLKQLHGSKTSVFIGGFCLDNQLLQLSELNRVLIDSHTATSASMTLLASRLSYTFDLKGPCLTLDTACSSSLVALHYACQSIIHKEADMAIAGGVNVMFKPENAIVMSKGQFLSPDARCMTFDAKANGYARGEGVGIVILKSLKQALLDNDRIHAVISATGVNQDGHTLGITLPNGTAQQDLMREVYHRAQVTVDDVGYIEAHGTGTQAGDITEVNSINALFNQRKKPVYIGSVKTNIGHLEAAAGVAGLIKAVLCLKHKKIPANLHFHTPNPHCSLNQLTVPVNTVDWPEESYASVNSFGYGGTNAHALLRTIGDCSTQDQEEFGADLSIPVVFSAMNHTRLDSVIKQYLDWLSCNPGLHLRDIAYTMNHKKTHFNYRLVTLVKSNEELINKLASYSAGESVANLFTANASTEEVVFVFTGMGPQRPQMGKELFEKEPIYRQMVLTCDSHLQAIAGWSILDELFKSEQESCMHEPRIAQLANFILQVSLTALLSSWGVKPAAVVGHSVGEIAAFYVSGVLDLHDAILISYHRSCLQNSLMGRGEMLAVNLSRDEIQPLLEGKAVAIAAVNSPNNVTLSGDKKDILNIAQQLTENKVFHRLLHVNLAYHSQVLEPIKNDFLSAIDSVQLSQNTIPLYSTVTGKAILSSPLPASYWWDNARKTVEFELAINSLLEEGFHSFIEIGPHPVLKNYLNEIAQQTSLQLFHTLNRHQKNEREYLLDTICDLYCSGISVNFNALQPVGQFIDTPLQLWAREKYWRESEASKQQRIGSNNENWFYQEIATTPPSWQVELNEAFFPYLRDHRIFNMLVFPGAAYISAAIALNKKSAPVASCLIEDMRFKSMLVYNENDPLVLTLTQQKEINKFSLHTSNHSLSQEHCTAFLYPMDLTPLAYHTDINQLKNQLQVFSPIEQLYESFDRLGLIYGNSFRTIHTIYRGDNQVLAQLVWNGEHQELFDQTSIYPPLLDGAFQSLIALQLDKSKAYLPHSIDKILFYKPLPKSCWSHAFLTTVNEKTLFGNVDIVDEQGELCLQLQGLRLKAITSANSLLSSHIYYKVQWHEHTAQPVVKEHLQSQSWIVIYDGSTHSELVQQLKNTIPNLVCVSWADERLQISDSQWQISAHSVEDYVWLWQRCQPEHIVYISSIANDLSLESVSEQSWGLIVLAKSLSTHKTPLNLFVLTWEAQHPINKDHLACSALPNLTRVIENEIPLINIKAIDTDRATSSRYILAELLSSLSCDTVVYRNNVRYIQQIEQGQVKKNEFQNISLSAHNVELKITQPGLLDSIFFISTPIRKPAANEIQIKVYASALNFKDLLKLSNKLDDKITENTFFGDSLGMEVAGVITAIGSQVTDFQCGDEVIAPLPQNFSSYAYVNQRYVLRKPSTLDFYQAPILTGFLAAYRGLVQIADIQPGEKVLIHNATGGVGMAAMQIAQWKQAEIYATAGTVEKRAYLQTLGIKYIYDSRTLLFKEQVLRDTDGYGVDVVINSIAGDALIHSFNLLAPYGRFIEIGKKDIAENTLLPMQAFNQNISFSAVDIDRMLVDKMDGISAMSKTILALFEEGILTPQPVKVFPASAIKDAFHFMLQSKHVGKIVIDYKNQQCPVAIPAKKVDGQASYIVTGGTSGFGLEAGTLLAKEGAGKVYLLSRHGQRDLPLPYANLEARALDVGDKEALTALFFEISQSPFPLKGIVHSAMVLDDSLIHQLEREQFDRVLQPKVAGAINLHELTETLDLDFFIMFSSISSLIGTIGQASYVAANGFLDALADYRQQHDLPCTSINWGVFTQTGVVARSEYLQPLLNNAGIKGFNNDTALHILNNLFCAPSQSLGVFDIDWGLWSKQYKKMASKSLFNSLLTQNEKQESTHSSLHEELMLLPANARMDQLSQIIRDKLAVILKMQATQIDVSENITYYGVDSILAIELVNLLRSTLEITLSPADFMEGKSIKELAGLLTARYQPISA